MRGGDGVAAVNSISRGKEEILETEHRNHWPVCLPFPLRILVAEHRLDPSRISLSIVFRVPGYGASSETVFEH